MEINHAWSWQECVIEMAKAITRLETSLAALESAKPAPLEWPAIDLGPVTGTEKA